MNPQPASTPAAAGTTVPALNPTDIFGALSNDIRWRALELMAGGAKIRATDLTAALGRDFDICSKHLSLLARSGAADWERGEDQRTVLYFIPEQYRPQPGVVDYGFCAVRFGDAAKPAERIPMAKD
jgi:hypothetical protein